MINYTRNTLNYNAMTAAQARWDAVAKPLKSLGALEDIVIRMAGIAGTADVSAFPRSSICFCADHGVVAQGVTQSDQEVTALVARSVAEGNANINLMARCARAEVIAVDVGIAHPLPHEGLISRPAGRGTADMTCGPAMTAAQAEYALQTGIDMVVTRAQKGDRLIATGEMGIGNTTASAALCCALLGLTPDEAVGRGAGLSDEGLQRKREAVATALSVNAPRADDPMDTLMKVGGFEIAAMAGAFLGGMTARVPVIIDGAISAVSALLAARLCPDVRGFMLASHMSREPIAPRIMAELGLEPIVRAGLALGEGTGAVTLMPLIDMALSVYSGTHTFDSLGMDAYTPQGGQV